MLSVAEIFLATFAIIIEDARFTAHRESDRIIWPKLDELFRRFEKIGWAAGLVVPLRQLLPAPVINRLQSHERLHFTACERKIATASFHPGGPALQDHRRVVLEDN